MKTRVIFFFIVLFLVVLFASKENSYVKDKILLVTTPIKVFYVELINDIEKFKTEHFFQEESINRLQDENRRLKKYLIEQTNYLNQIDKLFDIIPSLERLPHQSIIPIQPIGYSRLNSYSTILLNRPQSLQEDQVYGLMQNSFVVGTAQLRNGILYGHLLSSPDCRFSVYIGAKKAPGVAIGSKNGHLTIEYIPKWSKIAVGDTVETSGVDQIFFANVPVGKVKSIKVKSSYKTAVVEAYADYLHIDYLFLIHDPAPTLVSKYNGNTTKLYPYNYSNNLQSSQKEKDKNQSSGDVVQTTIPEVDPQDHETPSEENPVKKRATKKHNNRVPSKPKLPARGLDMF